MCCGMSQCHCGVYQCHCGMSRCQCGNYAILARSTDVTSYYLVTYLIINKLLVGSFKLSSLKTSLNISGLGLDLDLTVSVSLVLINKDKIHQASSLATYIDLVRQNQLQKCHNKNQHSDANHTSHDSRSINMYICIFRLLHT